MTFKLLDLGNKTYYVYIIIYLRTVSGTVTFAAFTAVVTKIRVFVVTIKRPTKKSLNIRPFTWRHMQKT